MTTTTTNQAIDKHTIATLNKLRTALDEAWDNEPELLKRIGITDDVIENIDYILNTKNADNLPVIINNTRLFKFNQLSEDAQQKVLEKLWDINVDYEWWDGVYDDAEQIGLNITEFEIDRGRWCKGDFNIPCIDVAETIMGNHGIECETYKDAKIFIDDYNELVAKYSDGVNTTVIAPDKEYESEGELLALFSGFRECLLADYSRILEKEYEYLTSKEAILETIKANEYTFEIDGKMNNG